VDWDRQEVEQCSRNRFRFRMARAIEENGELVAADSSATGIVGRRLDELFADFLQQLVAGKVAVQIVDPLEMVEVEQEERAGSLRLHRRRQSVHQLAAIAQASGRIGVGILHRQLLGHLVGVQRFLQILGTAPTE
jgi:hypothetical protein